MKLFLYFFLIYKKTFLLFNSISYCYFFAKNTCLINLYNFITLNIEFPLLPLKKSLLPNFFSIIIKIYFKNTNLNQLFAKKYSYSLDKSFFI